MKNYFEILEQMISYYEKQDFKGFDPYDLKGAQFFYNLQKYFGSFGYHLTDILNLNFPIFLRKLLNVAPKQNSKAFAVFLFGVINLYRKTSEKKYLEISEKIYQKVMNLKSQQYENLCFGYPFNWYNGNEIAGNTPNVVVSSFVGMAFLELYKINQNKEILENCESIANFILTDLNCYKDERGICFSYTPIDEKRVHNANLLAGQFLSHLSKINGKYRDKIEQIVLFTLSDMNENYSWNYFDKFQISYSPIDNYHTAFVLSSLYEINKNMNFHHDEIILNALKYYTSHLFENSIPILSDYQKLPINIHSCASAVICLKKLENIKDNSLLINNIINFTMTNLYDERENYFYYRINKLKKIKENKNIIKRMFFDMLMLKKIDKTRYMRWNDAWMFYALSEVL